MLWQALGKHWRPSHSFMWPSEYDQVSGWNPHSWPPWVDQQTRNSVSSIPIFSRNTAKTNRSRSRSDTAIALSCEAPPFLRGGAEFDFRDNTQIPLRIALNTPFISKLVRFSSCADALHIHPAVASILDDIRFLLATVLALPEKPTAKELQKVHSTSAWIHERISNLPTDSPAARRSSGNSPTLSLDAGPSSAFGHNRRDTPETTEDQQQQNNTSASQSLLRHRQRQQQQASPCASTQSIQDHHPHRQTPSPPPPPPQSTTTIDPSISPNTDPDYIYQTTRLAALLYTRAISHRLPFSLTVTPLEFESLWTTTWRVPLSTWRSLLGVFNWVLLPLVSSSRAMGTGHERYVRGMMNIGLLQAGMENWEVARGVMEGGVRLQAWLGGGKDDREGEEERCEQGGEGMERRWSGGSGNRSGEGSWEGKGKERERGKERR